MPRMKKAFIFLATNYYLSIDKIAEHYFKDQAAAIQQSLFTIQNSEQRKALFNLQNV